MAHLHEVIAKALLLELAFFQRYTQSTKRRKILRKPNSLDVNWTGCNRTDAWTTTIFSVSMA